MLSRSMSIGRPPLRPIPILRSIALRSPTPAWRCRTIATQSQTLASKRKIATTQPFPQTVTLKRSLSTTQSLGMDPKATFPAVPASVAPQIAQTGTVWKHEIFTEIDMDKVQVAHRDTHTMSDKVALGAVRFLRSAMDFATGYRHPDDSKAEEGAKAIAKPSMTEAKWLVRFIFLESVAGVPGMVGGMLRHMRSLRRMKRDNGWIETLIEESFNERMHLLTFLKLHSPGIFMRTMILGAQGVFFNAFFLSYIISPRTCHRFVGYLEEEAVITYSRALKDLDAGKLPLWNRLQAPEIAVQYWDMPEGHRTMKDLLLYIRADEAKHREVNHTLGNLDQETDPNPFNSKFIDPSKPHPSKGLANLKGVGWTRGEAL